MAVFHAWSCRCKTPTLIILDCIAIGIPAANIESACFGRISEYHSSEKKSMTADLLYAISVLREPPDLPLPHGMQPGYCFSY